jgi:hypothetical protein
MNVVGPKYRLSCWYALAANMRSAAECESELP